MDTTNKYFLPVAVVLAGVLIAGAVLWNGSHPAGTTDNSGTAPANVNIADVKTDGDPYIGNVNAPVTIAFWSDYQCPFCKQFETTTLPQIIQNYVNAGKVKVVFMDFSFLGPNSTTDAEWARSIWKLYPNAYFAWRTALFTNQPQENSLNDADNLAWLKKTTAGVQGIDVNKVSADVAANKAAYDAMADADKSEGAKEGVQATPSFIIGKELIQGAYPYATFQAAIDKTLAK